MPTDFNLADQMLSEELKFLSSRGFRNGYLWEVKKIRAAFEVCPKCATQSNTLAGKAYSTVREAPIRDKPLWLRIEKHRYYCKTCRKPFTESVRGIWPRRRSTGHFRNAVARDCKNYVNLDLVREHHSCSSGFIYKERLRQFYNCRNRRQGRRNLECFIADLRNSTQAAAQTLGRTLRKWLEQLVGYFENRWTNGFTEATNGNAKALQKRARGFKNFVNYRLKTLNTCFY